MLTYKKYTQHIEEEFNKNQSNEKIKTTLEAKFSFKDRIHHKIENTERTLSDYLLEVEGVVYNPSKSAYVDYKFDKKRSIIIKKRFQKVGFDIKVISPIALKPKEMLDLDALEKFVLTGEYPIVSKD